MMHKAQRNYSQTAHKEFLGRKLAGVSGETLQVGQLSPLDSIKFFQILLIKDPICHYNGPPNIFDMIVLNNMDMCVAEGKTWAAKFVASAPKLSSSTRTSATMSRSSNAKSANIFLTQTSVNIVSQAEG